MKDSRKEADRWWKQAENDYKFARVGLDEGFYSQTCFLSHQACEKALKAVHYTELDKRIVIGHSLVKLAGEIRIDKSLLEDLTVLDQFYIPTRYPNGLPDVSPFEAYTKRQAEESLRVTGIILDITYQRIY